MSKPFESGKTEGKVIYELNEGDHHDHLVCVDCGHVKELVDPTIEKFQQEIAKNPGFGIMEHAIALQGTCSKKNISKWKKTK